MKNGVTNAQPNAKHVTPNTTHIEHVLKGVIVLFNNYTLKKIIIKIRSGINMVFSFNFNRNGDYNKSEGNETRLATTAQKNFYVDLCIQRGITPKDTSKMSYEDLDVEIKALRNSYPASDNQKAKITELIAQLNEIGINVKPLDEKELNKLTGGRNGTASALIESLIKLLSENTDKMKPTDKQLEVIVSWFLCPDVPFEDYGITRKVPIEHLESYSSDLPYEEQTAQQLWRKPTPDEFAELIVQKFNRADASAFIDKYRSAFFTWKQSRCTAKQKEYIRSLEARLCDTSTTKEITFSIDAEGNINKVESHKPQHDYNPQGYQPLSDDELDMMSVDDASKYIEILNSEIENKSLYKFNYQQDETLELLRKPEGYAKQIEEFQNLNDLMYAFEALAGYNDDDLHECATELVTNKEITTEDVEQKRSYIRDFMVNLLKNNCIDFAELTKMCEKSTTAQNILLDIKC